MHAYACTYLEDSLGDVETEDINNSEHNKTHALHLEDEKDQQLAEQVNTTYSGVMRKSEVENMYDVFGSKDDIMTLSQTGISIFDFILLFVSPDYLFLDENFCCHIILDFCLVPRTFFDVEM